MTDMTTAVPTIPPDVDDHAFVGGHYARAHGDSPEDPCSHDKGGCGLPRGRHQHPEGTEALWMTADENRVIRAAFRHFTQALADLRRTGTLPDVAYEAVGQEYDAAHAMWGRVARMPEVGEK